MAQEAAEQAHDDPQLARMAGQFGQHRGRRVIGFLMVAALGMVGGRALLAGRSEVQPAAELTSESDELVALVPTSRPVAPARKPARKRAAKARGAAPISAPPAAASVFRATGLPPPPPMPAPEPFEPEPFQPASARVEPELAPMEIPVPAAVGAPVAGPGEDEALAPVEPAPSPAEPIADPVLLDAAGPLGDDGNGEAIARRIAAEKRQAIRDCYERELKLSPKLRGNVLVEMDLAPSQRVDGVRVTDDLDRPAFTQCVSRTMHDVTFLALNEEVSIRLPFVLTAR